MKTLLVVAHPDDEVIFFWWVLQNIKYFNPSILCCSSDENNLERRKWAHRKQGLIALCSSLNIPLEVLPYGSGFYRTDGRSGKLAALEKDISGAMDKFDYDMLITHNPWGEYGHADHTLINNFVSRYAKTGINYSDIFIQTEWTSLGEHPKIRKTIKDRYSNSLDEYAMHKKFYTDIKAWTWNKDPVRECLCF